MATTRATALEDAAVVAAAEGWRSCVGGELGALLPDGVAWPGDVARVSDLGLTNGPGEPTTVQLDQASERCRGNLDQAFDTALVRAEAAFVRSHHEALAAHRDSLVADHRALGLSVTELE